MIATRGLHGLASRASCPRYSAAAAAAATAATAAAAPPTLRKTTTRRTRMFSTSRTCLDEWGFVGLGRMGFPMAKNLRAKLPKEHNMTIFDINSDTSSKLVAELPKDLRVDVAHDVRQVAQKCSTIITALPDSTHVRCVYQQMLEPPELSARQEQGKERLFIDCSTIDPMTSNSLANMTHFSGQGKYVDAPMSGGVVGARAGTLTFMVGAPRELVQRVTDALMLMGSKVMHMGEQSSGVKAKLANNYLLAMSNIATAEAMNMGLKWGLSGQALAGLINSCTGRCWPSEANNPVPGVSAGAPAERDYGGGFAIELASKDVHLAVDAAEEAGAKLALGEPTKALYKTLESDARFRGRDFSVVYRYLVEGNS